MCRSIAKTGTYGAKCGKAIPVRAEGRFRRRVLGCFEAREGGVLPSGAAPGFSDCWERHEHMSWRTNRQYTSVAYECAVLRRAATSGGHV